MPSSSPSYLRIPDLLADWPWQRRVNPCYGDVVAETNAWFKTFSTLNPKSRRAFEKFNFALLTALIYPDVTADQLRSCIDFVNIFFLLDEYIDVEPVQRVREIVSVCVDALRYPSKPRPDGEVVFGEMLKQFWDRAQNTITHQSREPFVASLIDFLHSTVAKAEIRESGGMVTAEVYRAIRLKKIGIPILYTLGGTFLSIPDRVHDHPLYIRMASLGCEMIAIENDLLSYNRERASGEVYFNIVTITMQDDGLSLDDAIRSLIERDRDLAAQYLRCFQEYCSILERQGDMDEASRIRRYLDLMGNIRRATWCWSFESSRYFGERGSTYAKTQLVPLVPKDIRDRTLRENQVDVLLMEEELAKI